VAAKKKPSRGDPASTSKELVFVRPSVRTWLDEVTTGPDPDGGLHEILEQLRGSVALRALRADGGERSAQAHLIVNGVVNALRSPAQWSDRWLREVWASMAADKPLSRGQKRALVVRAIRTERADLEELRESLSRADAAFSKVPDEKLRRILAKVRDVTKGGAGLWGVYSAAAALALEVGAFGDKRARRESTEAALERVAKAFERAAKRAEQAG
jgi:hypothetical protein